MLYKFEEKRKIVDAFFEILKNYSLTQKQANKFIEIIQRMNKTDLQKERFIKIYNLKFAYKKKPTHSSIAKEYNCSASAIRSSTNGMLGALYRIPSEDITILKEIVKEHQKENIT